MTRLLKSKIGPAAPANLFDSQPWISSGVLTASTVIKDKPGVFGGIIVIATDTGADISVKVWDSPDSTLTSDVELAWCTGTTATALAQSSIGAPSQVGVEATLGIYVEVLAGDCSFIVYYK
jgi:hypothetical protein